jgi:hypothetical protein
VVVKRISRKGLSSEHPAGFCFGRNRSFGAKLVLLFRLGFCDSGHFRRMKAIDFILLLGGTSCSKNSLQKNNASRDFRGIE